MKLFDIMKIHEQMTLVMESVAKQQRDHDSRDHAETYTPDHRPGTPARLDQFTADIMKDLPVDGMLEDMVPVYQKHLSKSDVGSDKRFLFLAHRTETMKEMPAMTAESMQAAGPRMQAMMDKMMDRERQMAEGDRKKQKAAKPATDKKTDCFLLSRSVKNLSMLIPIAEN